jgi:hypothetical protein
MQMAMSAAARPQRLGLAHMAATGAAVLVFLVALLWATAASGALPDLRRLFGPIGAGSPTEIAIVLVCALIGGALIGLTTAFFYNLLRFLAAIESVERG